MQEKYSDNGVDICPLIPCQDLAYITNVLIHVIPPFPLHLIKRNWRWKNLTWSKNNYRCPKKL